MIIELSRGDFGSLNSNVPRLKVSNMYVVDNPLSVTQYSYIPRPSLNLLTSIVGENVRGIWYQNHGGVTEIYVVAGNTLYLLDSNLAPIVLGTITGTSFCSFASTLFHIGIVSDGAVFLYDRTTLTLVPVPDGQFVSTITSLDNYFVLTIKNSNKFYWIDPGATTIDPLAFASSERNPDDTVNMISISDEIWSLGKETVEIFVTSGDDDAPFNRIAGRVYQLGCVDKNSVVRTLKDSLPCLIWVTPSKEVILAQGVPNKISNESVEELLKEATTFMAWAFRTNKHDFYVLNTDTGTVVYDLTANLWYRWASYQKDTWDAFSGIQINDEIYAVNRASGDIYTLTYRPEDITTDFLVCEVGGYIPHYVTKPMPCSSVSLFLNYGYSQDYAENPVIEFRWSDDAGATWSPYLQAGLGLAGNYYTDIKYRSVGHIRKPGRFVEFRFSEIQNFRFDGAVMNDEV